jgi:hypothetical protein
MLIGYARVSSDDQDTAAQMAALKAAKCERIYRRRFWKLLDRRAQPDTLARLAARTLVKRRGQRLRLISFL